MSLPFFAGFLTGSVALLFLKNKSNKKTYTIKSNNSKSTSNAASKTQHSKDSAVKSEE